MKCIHSGLFLAILLTGAIAPSDAHPNPSLKLIQTQPIGQKLAMNTQSDQLYVKVKVSPQGIHKQYLILNKKGIAVRTKAGNLLTLSKNLQSINLGRYMRQGNRLVVQWSNGDRWQMSASQNGWQRGTQKANTYVAALPISNNQLPGQYRAESSRTAGLVGGPAPRVNAISQSTFQFSNKGQFVSTGFVGASGTAYNPTGHHSGRGVSTSHRHRAGRYQLGGYQLYLRDTKGRQTQHTIFRLPGWGNAIMIDGRIYQKR